MPGSQPSSAEIRINVLLGENGAGKSTLIKIIAGVERPNGGSIYWQGEEVEVKNTREAHRMGVSVIYQELSSIQCLNVIENMFVGNELTYDKKGVFINSPSAVREPFRGG